MSNADPFADLDIRPFSSREDYMACTALQEEVWGQGFNERIPAAMLMIANKLGGLSAGAFDVGGQLQGFVFGVTGFRDGEPVHWSDMLAVRSHLRNQGLGTRLKHYQREFLLARGISVMHWTFDPLQSRNAYVNFRKLGIMAREFVRDMYGETGSPLHGGMGTDRFVATWEMDSQRVRLRLKGEVGDEGTGQQDWREIPRALGGEAGAGFPRPTAPDLALNSGRVLVAIPRNVEVIMAQDPALALRWREATREVFQFYLERGYQAREFFPEEEFSHYLLVRSPEGMEPGDAATEGNAG